MNLSKLITARLNWKIEKRLGDSEIVLLTNYKTGERLFANKNQLFGFLYEDWEAQYLPTEIVGKRVLDIGAGWGETIYFYLKHGYEVTAAIEANPVNLSCLNTNSVNQKWKSEIIRRGFNLEDLSSLRPLYDFVKMDIEGGEKELLKLDVLPPIIFETHSNSDTRWFLHKFPRLKMKYHRKETAILSNVG